LKIEFQKSLREMERATGIEPVLPAWESKFPLLYFHNLQNRSGKINVHATHTVHAVPDFAYRWGTFGGRFVLFFGTGFEGSFRAACLPENSHDVR
jgi:hypothetical protein